MMPQPAPALPDAHWQPRDTATLCFILQNDSVLLIHKKRGLGHGMFNGPGGRLDPGETPEACVVRECREELLIEPLHPTQAGLLEFQFTDGYSLRCHVFRAAAFHGTPTETDEAIPHWFPIHALPYDRMWSDDRHWFPLLLEKRWFHGQFLFDQQIMLAGRLNNLPLPLLPG